MTIREEVLKKIKRDHSTVNNCNWDKIIDKSIYDHNGLRMIGSVKKNTNKSDHYKVVKGGFLDDNSAIVDNEISLELIKKLSIKLFPDSVLISMKNVAIKDSL